MKKEWKERLRILPVKVAYMGFCTITLAAYHTEVVRAETMWEVATTLLRDVYSRLITISTLVAVVTAAAALIMMNFSRSGRTVDESRAWLKRILITWIILNGLGFIMAYITPYFQGGQWTP